MIMLIGSAIDASGCIGSEVKVKADDSHISGVSALAIRLLDHDSRSLGKSVRTRVEDADKSKWGVGYLVSISSSFWRATVLMYRSLG